MNKNLPNKKLVISLFRYPGGVAIADWYSIGDHNPDFDSRITSEDLQLAANCWHWLEKAGEKFNFLYVYKRMNEEKLRIYFCEAVTESKLSL